MDERYFVKDFTEHNYVNLLNSKNESYSKLQVLTHPELWVLELTLPGERIQRCAKDTALASMPNYDAALDILG